MIQHDWKMNSPVNNIKVGTCKSDICVQIESPIKSGVKIRIRIESRIEYFQLQRILIVKISNHK